MCDIFRHILFFFLKTLHTFRVGGGGGKAKQTEIQMMEVFFDLKIVALT